MTSSDLLARAASRSEGMIFVGPAPPPVEPSPLAPVFQVTGLEWQLVPAALQIVWTAICWSAELQLFVAVGNTDVTDRVMTSRDGIHWLASASAVDNIWLGVCWSPELELFVAVGRTGSGNRVMTSPDGISWTARASAADHEWNGICWSPERQLLVAVASDDNASSGGDTLAAAVAW